ncbi:MAG: hypothetical protein PHS41_05505 [Victivallaceae bacterium]|nr:hypothetical protein [Victivallaceae bacterium]
MTLVSWLIVIIPVAMILGIAFFARRYVRDVADYLAAGRVAGRYVISVGDLASGLSVITLVALCEQNYQCGMAMTFWNQLTIPLGIFMSLTGYCVYRFRASRCLSGGQFLEQRYSRNFRIVGASIRTLAEMVTNAIGPAVAVRFFIYFLGIPHKIPMFGFQVPTYGILVAILLALALALIWPAGRISLLITDCLQSIISYPIFVVITVFILANISWFGDVTPVMLDRTPGESFLNPMDIQSLRDFNMFSLVVVITSSILNRAAFIGNDTTSVGRTPHEQKMAGILGTWRNGFAMVMTSLVAIFVIAYMVGGRFAEKSHQVRVALADKVTAEVFDEAPAVRAKVMENVRQLPVEHHVIGRDRPYGAGHSPDKAFLQTTLKTVTDSKLPNGNAYFQEFRSLYNQMMMPTMLRSLFPPVLMGVFALLMVMLLLSTDDSRIFNASSTLIQDVILPLKKNPMSTEEHLIYLKLCTLGVTIFFFVVSLFFAQMDYITMFTTIMCAVWMGASGPIMVGGFYTRWGNTTGAWSALLFGSGLPVLGLFCQRNWADLIYPWLENRGYVQSVGRFLEMVSGPFNPYIVWKMDPIKFPINSYELYFIAMMLGIAAYVIGSMVTYKGPFNLDRLYHKGIYSDDPDERSGKKKGESAWTLRNVYSKLIGIDSEYTTGDKVIAWSVFVWSGVYSFGGMFVGVLIWNFISPWPAHYWGVYFFISMICTALIVGVVSTVWFFIGGLIDLRRLFLDLEKRVANPLDNGVVEGHVSLADKARFDAIEQEMKSEHKDDSAR